jgi:phosphate transport system substrate-binding protein
MGQMNESQFSTLHSASGGNAARIGPLRMPARRAACAFILLTCAVATIFVGRGVHAQSPAAAEDPVALQKARAKWLVDRKQKVFYTGKRFDVDLLPHYVPEQQVTGTLRIWGLNYISDAMLSEYWEKGFRKYQPGIKFEWYLPTALTATSGLVAGTADIGANRKMTFTEILQYQRVFNHNPFEVPMSTGSLDVAGWSDAMVIFVNKKNPITRLTLKQLDGIFGAARLGDWQGLDWHHELGRGRDENIRTWGQLGMTGEWKDKPIHPYGAVVRYDTATKFSDVVLRGSDQWNEDLRMFANAVGPDGKLVVWSQQIADELAKDPYGIGYDGHGFMNENMKTVAIQFEEGGPFVEPTLENIQNRSFKLFQANYWYINREPGKPIEPKIKEFLKYVLSREGQEEVIRDGKYTPLNANVVREALKSLE